MAVDIIFMDEQGDKIARVHMMSNFENILMNFGFEGHSREKFWDYDEYGYIKDKTLVQLVWYGCVKAGYISEGHADLGNLAPVTQFLVEGVFSLIGTYNRDVSKIIDYNEYIAKLPIKYDDVRLIADHTSGYVICEETVILDFWNIFKSSLFKTFKCHKLEIIVKNLNEAMKNGGVDGWV